MSAFVALEVALSPALAVVEAVTPPAPLADRAPEVPVPLMDVLRGVLFVVLEATPVDTLVAEAGSAGYFKSLP